MLAASKYSQMKKEVKDVIDIFLDDTKNSEQTIQLITEIAGAAIATQGLGDLPNDDKGKVAALMVAEIGIEAYRASLIDETT